MVVDTAHHRVIAVPPDQAPVDDGQDVLATAIRHERLAASGAQPVDVLLAALNQAWEERAPEPVAFAEGAVCGPEGC